MNNREKCLRTLCAAELLMSSSPRSAIEVINKYLKRCGNEFESFKNELLEDKVKFEKCIGGHNL